MSIFNMLANKHIHLNRMNKPESTVEYSIERL